MGLKRTLILVFQTIVFWMLAFFLYIFVKYNGLEEELKIYTDDALYLPVTEFFQYGLLLGLIIGVFYTIIEYLFDSYLSKKLILGLSIIIKSVIYFILIVVILSVFSIFMEEQIDIDLPNDKGWWHQNPFFLEYHFVFCNVFNYFFFVENCKR